MGENNKKTTKPNKFKAFMYRVFVKNIGLKIFSIIFSVLLCLLVMGLKG